jgi:hypothetical protein
VNCSYANTKRDVGPVPVQHKSIKDNNNSNKDYFPCLQQSEAKGESRLEAFDFVHGIQGCRQVSGTQVEFQV